MASSCDPFTSNFNHIEYIKVQENVFIQLNNNPPLLFINKVCDAFKMLSNKEVGNRLITKIGKGKHIVVIKYSKDSDYTRAKMANYACMKGFGSDSKIKITEYSSSALDFDAKGISIPFFIKLAHELIHAYHNSYGKNIKWKDSSRCKEDWTNPEEIKTVMGAGYGNYARSKPKICENAIREEHGLPLRFSHHGANVTETKKEEIKTSILTYKVASIGQLFLGNPYKLAISGVNKPAGSANIEVKKNPEVDSDEDLYGNVDLKKSYQSDSEEVD